MRHRGTANRNNESQPETDIIMEMHEIVTRILTAIHCRTNLLKLLLRSQLIRMSTTSFTTIGGTRRETGITFAANHLFAVIF